jgi:hypothetical protein
MNLVNLNNIPVDENTSTPDDPIIACFGDYIKIDSINSLYLLVLIPTDRWQIGIVAIDINSGKRWRDITNVRNPREITFTEMKDIIGYKDGKLRGTVIQSKLRQNLSKFITDSVKELYERKTS